MGKRPATYQDVLDAPEHLTAEIIGGELFLTPRPAEPHAVAASRAGATLGFRFDHGDGPGGWVVLYEPELWLGEDPPQAEVLVPDLAGWRRERYRRPEVGPGFTVPPDWVCEVLSPSTARKDRLLKRAVYARRGVPWYWLIDPVAETIEVLALRGADYAHVADAAGHAEARLPPFDALALPVGRWWSSWSGPPGA